MGALALTFAGAGIAFASDNPVADKEWALTTLQNGKVHSEFSARGAGVVVAVVDSGVDPKQPDLQGSFVVGANVTNPENPSMDSSDVDYVESHGTSIATIIAGHAHSDGNGGQYGMVGLADQAKIMPVVIGENGGTDMSLQAGIRYAVDHGAQVINISNGSPGTCPSATTAAIDYALSHNVVVAAATGNDALTTNVSSCPANVPGVLDVAAIDQTDHMDKYSHYGSDVTLAAPGVDMEVGLIGGKYGENSGSSLAAPCVAAEAALIRGLHPTWTQGQVVSTIIDNTAQAVAKESQPGKRYDSHVGYGVIDPLAALGAAEPASTANPLGGPAVSAPAGTGATASSDATTPVGSGNPSATASDGGKSSSSIGLIAGIIVAIVVVGGLVVFLATRASRRAGQGQPGGSGGGGNGYYPPMPQGGQYAPPPQGYQQPNPYQQPGPYQQPISYRQPGPYQAPGPYPQQSPQGNGAYQPQPGANGYVQPPGNPYQGQ
ncbi:S8 family peptidase [Actinospica robiniae]|uniref:S8 family peptidase n=1 Tax=Actinospica robiniae TaxID=304901 RepID=UPI000402357A|nr:S8 family serine peptidase [Actinospica robiniae]